MMPTSSASTTKANICVTLPERDVLPRSCVPIWQVASTPMTVAAVHAPRRLDERRLSLRLRQPKRVGERRPG